MWLWLYFVQVYVQIYIKLVKVKGAFQNTKIKT